MGSNAQFYDINLMLNKVNTEIKNHRSLKEYLIKGVNEVENGKKNN